MNFETNTFLAQQLKLGDDKAYDYLMITFYQNLCGYAQTLTNDSSLAEDIVQNVFVEIWENKKNINPNLSIKNYLYKSVYNEFIDQYRKNKPVIKLEKKYMEAIDLVIENEERDMSDLLRLIDLEINNLPSKAKYIFLLSKKEGLTHFEISEHLNISVKTIEGHMTRAFKILSEKLKNNSKAIFFLLFDFKDEISKNGYTN